GVPPEECLALEDSAAGAAGYTPKELHAATCEALTARGDDPDSHPAPRTVTGWLQRWAEAGEAAVDKTGTATVYTAKEHTTA
ncbi:hypothetical protein, partial [Streptomyces sp. SM12]|uniref:hypothetical protein n=1 Tax=Streptomyces sp. SM12 TaxID=1071602 RepID=UPI001CA48A6F